MSLAKIPVVLIVCYAFKRGISPPNRPPPKEERIETRGILEQDWYFGIFGPAGNIQLLFGFLEALTIVSWNYRSLIFCQTVLTTLVARGGRPDQLHLSIMGGVGGLLILAGTALRLATYRCLGKFFKYEASIQKDHLLITHGPYAFVRHPSYTALLISHSGWILWNCADGSWFKESGLWNSSSGKCVILGYFIGIVCGSLYLVLTRMKVEDEALKKRFGRTWEEWAQKVPYFIVPGVF